MSRFFATGGSDSGDDSQSEEEQVVRHQVALPYIFSDGEEEVKRVVRSAKDKHFDELKNVIRQIMNSKKIKDMASIQHSFETLWKLYLKGLPIIEKQTDGVIPVFFIRCIVELDEFVNELWENQKVGKVLSKSNTRALTTLKQKLRKSVKELEAEITAYKANPETSQYDQGDKEDGEDDDDDDDDDGDLDNEFEQPQLKKGPSEESGTEPKQSKADFDGDGSEDSMDWGSDSDSNSFSSEDGQYTSIRERFLKKTTDKEEEEKKEKKKDRKEKDRKKIKKEDEEDDGGEWETVKGGVAIPSEKPKMFAKDAEIDLSLVLKKLNEIIAARGKKRTDRREQIELLHELATVADIHKLGQAINIKIKLSIIAAIFDYNPKISDAMKPEYWAKLLDRICETLDLLLVATDIEVSENIAEENEVFDEQPYKVRGCILTVLERLDEEFTKLLKECDPHSNEYVQRLTDETRVCAIIDKVQSFLEKEELPSNLCRIYLRKVEHLYYKFDPTVIQQKKEQAKDKEIFGSYLQKVEGDEEIVTSLQIMDKLCKYIYDKDVTDRIRTRAILAHVYHHALHDNWFQARDLMLMSHLQEAIHHSDPSTQILYNRTMAHLGLCAFRHANIKDSHNCLVDLMMTGKTKELLAQGLMPQRQHERSKEQEKVEKQRQMPFHMHINLELIECVYLVSAMLIEIPYMAAHEFDARRRMISKTFYQQLRSSERQSLVGPPESMREHVVAASKAMRNGNWVACKDFIINTKMNAKVWDLFYEADKVREMLTRLIKEESLRTYLFTYSHVYASISIATLCDMFELDKFIIYSIVSKMIINEELMASLDDPSQTVVMHKSEPSRLQSLALQLADKVNNLVDSNERIFDTKLGNFFQRGGTQGAFRQNYNRSGPEWKRRDRGGEMHGRAY